MMPPIMSEDKARDWVPASGAASAAAPVSERETLSPGSLEVRWIRDVEGLDALRPCWNRLSGGIPFRRWEWLVPWWKHFHERRDTLFVLTVTDATGEIVGIAPWFLRHSAISGRVLRFLGSGMVCSDYLTILHAPGREAVVTEALASQLTNLGPGCTWMELGGVWAQDAAVRCFVHRLREGGNTADERPQENCWRIELPDSWEDYLRLLSKSRREKVRQLTRRLLDTPAARIHVADSSRTLRDGLAVLNDLHQRRRRSLGQPGCFASNAFREFLEETAEAFLDLGRLRLQWIEIDSRPVVAEIDFADDDTLYMYQTGIDPRCAGQRPGWLGTIASLRHAIDAGYRGYDFLRGDEPYKAHWRAEPKPMALLRVFPRSLRASLVRTVARNSLGRSLTRGLCALKAGFGKRPSDGT